jgi:hypothetical protein
MKASIVLFWHHLFNRKNIWKIDLYPACELICDPYKYGDLLTRTSERGDGYSRYIKDGWVVKTDGMYPRHLVIRDKVRSFFRFTVSFWYLDFIRFLCRLFPSWANKPADSRFAKIVFWPLKNSWK